MLADKKKINSVKVQACELKKEEDLEFEVRTDFRASAVCVTRVR
jgi:hypothetical protein